jgi:hypothetical protein
MLQILVHRKLHRLSYQNIYIFPTEITAESSDSDFPLTPGSGGSLGCCRSVKSACENAVSKLKKNRNIKNSEEVVLKDFT